MYMWQQVKALKSTGLSIKEITRHLKLSRTTVRKYLRSNEAPRFKQRRTEKALDKYEATIREMLGKGFIGTRIYEELRVIGYSGSLSSVHRYIACIVEGEKKKAKVTTRVESEPGSQMQYDWKEWELPVSGKDIKIYIHEVVLSYSRMKYYACSLSITTSDVIRAIEDAILYFGGIAPEIVIDNPKQMVIVHEKNGIVRYNEEFLKFCGLYGLQRVCVTKWGI
ncbi:MAG: transposase [Nitrospirae bacterium]|nr:transposase [Nitrospirota bacterium]